MAGPRLRSTARSTTGTATVQVGVAIVSIVAVVAVNIGFVYTAAANTVLEAAGTETVSTEADRRADTAGEVQEPSFQLARQAVGWCSSRQNFEIRIEQCVATSITYRPERSPVCHRASLALYNANGAQLSPCERSGSDISPPSCAGIERTTPSPFHSSYLRNLNGAVCKAMGKLH